MKKHINPFCSHSIEYVGLTCKNCGKPADECRNEERCSLWKDERIETKLNPSPDQEGVDVKG